MWLLGFGQIGQPSYKMWQLTTLTIRSSTTNPCSHFDNKKKLHHLQPIQPNTLTPFPAQNF